MNRGRPMLPWNEVVERQMDALAEIWKTRDAMEWHQTDHALLHLANAERELKMANGKAEGLDAGMAPSSPSSPESGLTPICQRAA